MLNTPFNLVSLNDIQDDFTLLEMLELVPGFIVGLMQRPITPNVNPFFFTTHNTRPFDYTLAQGLRAEGMDVGYLD
jgi:hypothetical protein